MEKIFNTSIVIDGLEFDTLLLNGRVINRITNHTINTYSNTHTFTGHGAILWKGLFFQLMDTMFADTLSHLNTLVHPVTHPADMITETATRIWLSPEEKVKISTIDEYANNYVHPNTHTLGEIVDSITRLRMTIYERDKIVYGEENANNYSHQPTHEMSDFDGLLDSNGYIDAPLRTYFYNNFRHGLIKPINIITGSVETKVNSCYGIDVAQYTGTGLNETISLPFEDGFVENATDKNGIYIVNSNVGSGIIDTFTAHPGALHMKLINGVISSSTLLSSDADEVSLVVGDEEAMKLNQEGIVYNVLGIKCTSSDSLTIEEDDVAWHTQRSRKFHLDRSYKTINNASVVRIYYYEHTDLRYILYSGGYDYLYRAVNNENVGSIRRLKTLNQRTLMYWSDDDPNHDYFTNIHIQWSKYSDNRHYFTVNVKRHTPNVQSLVFTQCGPEMSFMHAVDEEQRQVSVAPYITSTTAGQYEHVYCDEYLIMFQTTTNANHRLTIYRLNIANGTIVLHQEMGWVNISNTFPVDIYYHCIFSSFYNAWLYTNYIAYVTAGDLCILHRPLVGGQFIEIKNIHLSTGVVYGNQIRVLMFSEKEVLLLAGSNNYIHLLTFTPRYTNGATHFGLSLGSIDALNYHVENTSVWPGNSYKLENALIMRLKHHPTGSGGTAIYPAVGIVRSINDIYTRDITIWTPRIGVQQILTVPRNSDTITVGYYYNTDTSQHEVYISAGTWIYTYVWRPMQIIRNNNIGFGAFETVCRKYSITNFPSPMVGYFPMLLFVWRIDSRNAQPVVYLRYGERYALDSSSADNGTHTDAIYSNFFKYDELSSGFVVPFENLSTVDFNTATYTPGAEYIYFGFFGQFENLTVYDVKNDMNISCGGYADKTRFLMVKPGDIIELPFKPNIIMFRFMEEVGYFSITSAEIGFDKCMNFITTSAVNTNPYFIVNDRQITVKDSTPTMFLLVIAADIYDRPGNLIIDASVTNPFAATVADGYSVVGEKDVVQIKTSDIEIGLPDNLSGTYTGSRFIGVNKTGNIEYNGGDGVVWTDVDSLSIDAKNGCSHVPIARVSFTNGGIRKIIPGRTGNIYTVDWFFLTVGQTKTLVNEFFTDRIFVTCHVREGTRTYIINDIVTDSPDLSTPNGVKISFNQNDITVMLVRGQLVSGSWSLQSAIRLIVQRMF